MKSSIATLLCIISVLAGASQASYLERMEVRTADVEYGGMDLGNVDVTITNIEGSSCFISNLDHAGNDFQQGALDVYEGSDLEGCENFYAPFATVSTVKLTHSGTDAWTNEYIDLVFDDTSKARCPNGQQIDNNESVTINCYPM